MDAFKKFFDDSSARLKEALDDNDKLDQMLADAKTKFGELTSDEQRAEVTAGLNKALENAKNATEEQRAKISETIQQMKDQKKA